MKCALILLKNLCRKSSVNFVRKSWVGDIVLDNITD